MSLRIIAGDYRRRKLTTPSGETTRPYTDRVRQMVFDRITHLVEDARVADIFAGVGTMGLESLSRGAASCVFIEGDAEVHQHLLANVRHIAPDRLTLCWKTNIHRTSFRPKGFDDGLPYSLIFFDPPYPQAPLLNDGGVLAKALDRLAKPDISAPDATVLLRIPERFTLSPLRSWKLADCWNLSSMNVCVLTKQPTQSPE